MTDMSRGAGTSGSGWGKAKKVGAWFLGAIVAVGSFATGVEYCVKAGVFLCEVIVQAVVLLAPLVPPVLTAVQGMVPFAAWATPLFILVFLYSRRK